MTETIYKTFTFPNRISMRNLSRAESKRKPPSWRGRPQSTIHLVHNNVPTLY